MEKISFNDVEPDRFDADIHSDRRTLTGPLNTSHVAITRYVLEPGERFSGSVHAHADQEEVFIVLEGEATFETSGSVDGATGSIGDGEVIVGEDEAIRFAPGEFQSGRNATEGAVVALALGAPRDSEDVRISRIPVLGNRDVECPDCGHDHMRVPKEDVDGLECPACGSMDDMRTEERRDNARR